MISAVRCALFALLVLAAPARAEIAGQSDLAFTDAVGLWLQGEDAEALAALSALSNVGNTAAQVFLGRIEPLPYFHAHVTADMERKDRIALLRRDGGLSGKNWLAVAAETDPLAAALLDSRDVTARAAAVPALAEAGEVRALLRIFIGEMSAGNGAAMMDAMLDPRVRPHVGELARQTLADLHTTAAGMPPVTADQLAAWTAQLAEVPPTDADRLIAALNFADLYSNSSLRSFASGQVFASAPVVRPLVSVCEALCPDQVPGCAMVLGAASQTMGGATMATLSPVETLLPSATYQNAPRFQADILRQAAGVFSTLPASAQADACIVGHIDGEN